MLVMSSLSLCYVVQDPLPWEWFTQVKMGLPISANVITLLPGDSRFSWSLQLRFTICGVRCVSQSIRTSLVLSLSEASVPLELLG